MSNENDTQVEISPEKAFARLLADIARGQLYYPQKDGKVRDVHEQAREVLKQFPEYEEFWKLPR